MQKTNLDFCAQLHRARVVFGTRPNVIVYGCPETNIDPLQIYTPSIKLIINKSVLIF